MRFRIDIFTPNSSFYLFYRPFGAADVENAKRVFIRSRIGILGMRIVCTVKTNECLPKYSRVNLRHSKLIRSHNAAKLY